MGRPEYDSESADSGNGNESSTSQGDNLGPAQNAPKPGSTQYRGR